MYMTTITIRENIGLQRHDFGTISDLLAALEQCGAAVVLQELSHDDVSPARVSAAKNALKRYKKTPRSFTSV